MTSTRSDGQNAHIFSSISNGSLRHFHGLDSLSFCPSRFRGGPAAAEQARLPYGFGSLASTASDPWRPCRVCIEKAENLGFSLNDRSGCQLNKLSLAHQGLGPKGAALPRDKHQCSKSGEPDRAGFGNHREKLVGESIAQCVIRAGRRVQAVG